MIKRLILAIIFLVVVVGGLIGFNLFRSKMIKDFLPICSSQRRRFPP